MRIPHAASALSNTRTSAYELCLARMGRTGCLVQHVSTMLALRRDWFVVVTTLNAYENLLSCSSLSGAKCCSRTASLTVDKRARHDGVLCGQLPPVGSGREHAPTAVIMLEEEQCARSCWRRRLDAHVSPAAHSGAAESGHTNRHRGCRREPFFDLTTQGLTIRALHVAVQ
jgi:hypothetical protein